MTTAYSYDARNRMTKIEHKDGSTVLAGWSYGLDDNGNILQMASAVSGYDQAWDYGYDDGSRLAHAIRRNGAGIPALRYSYAYDDGDNLLTRQAVVYEDVLVDDFSDGEYTSNPMWSVVEGTWTASSNYLADNSSSQSTIETSQTEGDFDLWFSYYCEDDSSPYHVAWVDFRYVDGNNMAYLAISPIGMCLDSVVSR